MKKLKRLKDKILGKVKKEKKVDKRRPYEIRLEEIKNAKKGANLLIDAFNWNKLNIPYMIDIYNEIYNELHSYDNVENDDYISYKELELGEILKRHEDYMTDLYLSCKTQ